MLRRLTKRFAAALALGIALPASQAQIAQEPLLNRPNTVSPNLTLILDTSGSMDANFIYEYGAIDTVGYGLLGPQSNSSPNRPAQSPDVNRLHYDPRVLYTPRVDYRGVALAGDALSNSWRVYFRIGTGPYTTGQLGNLSDYHDPYTPPATEVAAGSSASYPIIVDTGTLPASTLFPKFTKRTDCVTYTNACTFAEERRNNSNWNKWYSTRGKMATTGIGQAFLLAATDSIRLGYGTISELDSNSRLARGVSSYGDAAGGTKDAFFTWLYGRSFANGTPNLVAVNRVGKYYERTDSDGPWATDPNPSSTGINTVGSPSGPGRNEATNAHASCRRSFSMLITDGYWNGGQPTDAGNRDNVGFSISPAVGPAFVYTPQGPYKDNASNTMADLAMYYWGRDLRPDLINKVPTINADGLNNPSTWQNVSFYAVTLGLEGTLPRTTATLASLTSGATSWPVPVENRPTTIDDTWHATINGRGEFLKANVAEDLTFALKKMLSTIAGTPQTLSGVAVSTTFLKSGTRKYKPEYIPGTWSGKLSAIELDPVTGNDKVPSNVFWQVERGLDSVTQEPISLIPAPNARNIFTWNGSGAVPFTAANTGLSTDLVNYLRGDTSKEIRKSGGTFRNREAKLGDIVNSSPAFILDNVNLKYETLLPAGSFGDYKAFVTAKAARAGTLFVGANDGMLHAFPDSNGVENFAFVPQAVVTNLPRLTNIPYVHQYYVDGPNTETDAYISGGWKNILLGTTGAGAKAIYAVDVTDPSAMDASKVMWEINSNRSGFSELGYVLSDVQAGILESGDWVAIFGNGYGSATGQASLFVVSLQTGALLKKIDTSVTGGNGLMGVRVVRNANQRIVGAYAGDLKGNMWKFDLTGASSASWKVGLSGSALYNAGATQPISAAPTILPHPNGGNVVSFGTGKFFENPDKDPPFITQHLYGIWDAQPFGAASTPAGAAVSGTGSLVEQRITTVSLPPATFYNVSANTVSWGNGLTGIRGWFINLPNNGQRLVYPMDRLAGTFIMASTISPVSASAADACVQTGSGSGWVYIMDGVTGAGPTKPTLDTNGDGVINDSDTPVNGYQDAVDGRPTPIDLETTATFTRHCIETAQATCTQIKLECGQPGASACPITATPGIKSREWRQLFMR